MSAFDDLVMSRVRIPKIERKPDEPGFISSAAFNFLGGLETDAAAALKALGVGLNARNAEALDEIASNLESEGNTELASKIRNTPKENTDVLGNELINTGQWLSGKAAEIDREYGVTEEDKKRDFLDLATDPEFWANPRGATAAITNGVATSVPFIAASAFAPEITLPTKVLQAARAIPFLGKAAGSLLGRGTGSALDKMVGSAAVTTPMDALLNSSEIYEPLHAQGYTDEQIAGEMGKAIREEIPYDLVANVLLGGIVSGGLGGAISGPNAGWIRRGIGGAAASGLDVASEGVQEMKQQQVTNKYSNRPYGTLLAPLPDEKAAFTMGAFGAAGPAAAGIVRDIISPPRPAFPPIDDSGASSDGSGIPPYIPNERNGIGRAAQEGGRYGIGRRAEQGGGAPRASMSTQGPDIDAQVANLKDGWSNVLPQIGGILKHRFGAEGVISSAARTEEHNAEIPGASSTSYHIQREDGGDAVDIVLPDGLTAEQAEEIKQYFKDSGMFKEVLFHDAGTGYHLHLGGLIGTNFGDGSASPSKREGHANAWAVYDAFRAAGYNDNAIAGILGRLQQEHNFSTDMAEEYDAPGIGRVGGLGMFQWQMDPEYGGRGNTFMQWAQDNNLDPYDPAVQAQYALKEAAEMGLTPDKMNGLTAEEAADYWTKHFEGGKPGSERQYANEWLERIKNGGSASGEVASPNARQRTQVDTYDDEMDGMYQNLINQWMEASQDNDAENLFGGLLQENERQILDMAREMQETQQEDLTPEQQADFVNDLETLIQNKDVLGIARMFPQQTMQILAGAAQRRQQGALPAPTIDVETGNLDAAQQGQEGQAMPQAGQAQPSAQAQAAPATQQGGLMRGLLALPPGNPANESGSTEGNGAAAAQAEIRQDSSQAQQVETQETPATAPQEAQESQENPVEAQRQGVPRQDIAQPQNSVQPVPLPVLGQQGSQPQGQQEQQPTPGNVDYALARAALAPMASDNAGRMRQGRAIRAVANAANVALPEGLNLGLDAGEAQAIQAAQGILRQAGVVSTTPGQGTRKAQDATRAALQESSNDVKKAVEGMRKAVRDVKDGKASPEEGIARVDQFRDEFAAKHGNSKMSMEVVQEEHDKAVAEIRRIRQQPKGQGAEGAKETGEAPDPAPKAEESAAQGEAQEQEAVPQESPQNGGGGKSAQKQGAVSKGEKQKYKVLTWDVPADQLDSLAEKYNIKGYDHDGGSKATVYFDSEKDSKRFYNDYANDELDAATEEAAESVQKQEQDGPTIVRTRSRLHIDGDGVHTKVVSQEEIPVSAKEEPVQKQGERGKIDDLVLDVLPEGERKGLGKAKRAIQRAAELGYKAVEGENAIESPDGKRYYMSQQGIEGFKKAQGEASAREETAQSQGAKEAAPQVEATGRSSFGDFFRAKYRNGEVTIRLSKETDGRQRTVKLSWDEVKKILLYDVTYTERLARLAPIVDRLTGDLKDRKVVGWNSAESLQSMLHDTLQDIERKIDSAVRLKESTPEIRARMKKLIKERDIGTIVDFLSVNDNTVSIQAFSDETGVKLSPVKKIRMQQVREYFGEEYDKWEQGKQKARAEKERQEAERKEQGRQEKIQKAEKDWREGKEITVDEFLLLCGKYGVDVPLRTKGVLKNKIRGIQNDGTIYRNGNLKKYPEGVANAYRALNEAMPSKDEPAQGNKKAAESGGKEEAASASNNDNNQTVKDGEVVVTGKEFGEYSDIKELRKKAVQYYSEHLQGTSVENAVLGKIDINENGVVNFTGSGKREFKNSSAKEHKLLLVKYLKKLIKDTTRIDGKSSSENKHDGEYFYYLHANAKIDGKDTPVEITLVKRNDGSIQYYNHTLPTEENKKDAVVSTGPESSNEALGTPSIPASSLASNVPQPQQKVNGQEKETREKGQEPSQSRQSGSLKERFDHAAEKLRDAGKAAAVLADYIDERVAGIKEDMDKISARPEMGITPERFIDVLADVGREAEEALTPGSLSAFNRSQKEMIRNRMRDALDAARTELEAHAKKLPGQEDSASRKEGAVRWGMTKDEADRAMYDALGITPEDAESEELSFTNEFGDTTDEEIAALEEELRKELSKLSANPVFNPRVYALALQLGGKYIQKGYRTFRKWLDKMRGKLGEDIEPWASAVWETLRTLPTGTKFTPEQIMAVSRAIGIRYEGGTTGLADIQKDITKNMSASNKKTFAPLIEASYNGIKKFYDEREAARNGETDKGGQGAGESAARGHRDVERGRSGGAEEERQEAGREPAREHRGGEPGEGKGHGRDDIQADGARRDAGGRENQPGKGGDDRAGDGARGTQPPILATEGESKHPGMREITIHLSPSGADAVREEIKKNPSKDGDKPAETPGHNYRITDKSGVGEGGEKTKFKQNIDAITLLKKLEAEGRRATPAEQAILAKFNGWGTVKSAFSNDPKWAKEHEELKALLTPEEYREAAAASLNAFYTSPEVVKAIWKGVQQLGFKGGRVLDPSMGSGNFFGLMPQGIMEGSSLHGVEKDSLTGRIAAQLYQKADVQVTGFEKTKLPNNYFDLAISNVPFGSTVLHDPEYEKTSTGERAGYRIHNYFFAKAIDKVRPGGLVVFITGPGTMQTTSAEAKLLRSELGRKADLVAAFKLPGNAFQKNAGTSVTTDIVILQKRANPKEKSKHAQEWSNVEQIPARVAGQNGATTLLDVNEYYKKRPGHMLGEPVTDELYGARDRLGLDGKGVDVGKALSGLMGRLPKDIFVPAKAKEHSTVESTKRFLADPGTVESSYVMKDGKPFQNIGGELQPVPAGKAGKAADFCRLRGALNALLKAQIDPAASDALLDRMRKDLNAAYDSFVKKHGCVNAKKNLSALSDDPLYGSVAAIEKYEIDKKTKKESAEKTDIFRKRTVGAIQEIATAETATDALAASISQRGRADIPYMANLLGMSEKDTIEALGDMLYENPATGQQELAEEYLSGNVREKLAVAETAAKTNPTYKRNVEALKKAQPVDYTEHDVKANLGAPWIPAEAYTLFSEHMVGGAFGVTHDPITNAWKVTRPAGSRYHGTGIDIVKLTQTWGTPEMPFNELLEKILGMKDIEVKKKDADGNSVVDKNATAAAVAKAGEIQEEFEKWLWADSERKEALLKTYNKMFNSEVERSYDGSALTLPGLALQVQEKLYPHQKNAIWRIMHGGNTLIAHCVGAGKTWEMVCAGMEMKRVGICRKPLYAVPNNVVEQFRKEFLQAYPNAKLLVLTAKDLPGAKLGGGAETFTERLDTLKHGKPKKLEGGKGKKRKKETADKKRERLAKRRAALSRIATEDWDGIIISHNLFANLPMSPEHYQEFYREQAEELEAAIRQAKDNNLSKRDVTSLENALENLKSRLERDVSEDRKEVVIPFEELGVDQIFVDEADKFKNLAFHTSMGRLSGISTSNAKRSTDMYVKTRYMAKTYGRGIVFATGTPISNSMNEMFTMQRYLAWDKLKDLGMNHFDSWAAMFGRKSEEAEPSPDGNGFRMVTKLKFTNLKALGKMFRSFADIKQAEDLPYLKRPKLKGGQRTVISVEASEAFNDLKKELLERSDAIRAGKPDKRKKKNGEEYDDNMLAVTNDFRSASLDMRLIDPSIPAEEAGTKIDALCDTVFRKYRETEAVKGAQVIFSDIGTPKAARAADESMDGEGIVAEIDEQAASVYENIKRGLVKRGIPANEIAFVHDGKNNEQRQDLFERVNRGEIRVFLGSTETMGAGTNFQKHLAALHHLDCPWKPRDVEQREGRILRQGNDNEEVEIFTYVTTGSYDANMWDKVRYKQQMIDSVMRGDPAVDEMEDINSDSSAGYGDIEAAAMDNPLMAEQVAVSAEVMRLRSLESTYRRNQRDMQSEAKMIPARIGQEKANAKNAAADIKERVPTKGDDFRMKLGGKTYTKRADASEALKAIDETFKDDTSKKIGEIGGFEIHMRHEAKYVENRGGGVVQHGRNVIRLVNHGSYGAEASVQSIEHAVNNAPEKALEAADKAVERMEAKFRGLNEEIAKPFKQQKELDEAVKRLEEIQRQLAEQGKPKEGEEEHANEDTDENAQKAAAEERAEGPANQGQHAEPRQAEEGKEHEVGKQPQPSPGETTNFTGGEFKHTKTGEMIPQAKIKGKVDADTYKKLAVFAKNHGGYYSRVSKSFLFKEAARRDDFLQVAEAYLASSDPKFSAEKLAEEQIRRMMMESKPVEDSDLTSSQRKLCELGEELGSPVVWVKGDPRLDGWHQNGVTFLNVNSKKSLETTFWHEALHWIKANNEEAFQEILSYVQENSRITPEQMEKWREKTGRHDLTDEEVMEEMLCDSFRDVASRVKEFRTMAKHNPGLAARFIAWVKRLMERFHEMMHGPEGKLTTAQRSNMVHVLGRLASTMVDGNGRKLFRVSDGGMDIRLANGQFLPAVSFSAAGNEKTLDNSDRGGDNKHKVTRGYADIPVRAQEFVANELKNQGLAHRVTPSDDVDSICDKVIAPLKEMVEVLLDRYQKSSDALAKERMLNQAAFFTGMIDEIRRDFNAGGRVYKIISESGLVRGRAREGSNLAKSLRYRGRQIEEAARTGKEIGVKTAGAVDGFSSQHQSIVDAIRKQDRGDGIKFSANLNTTQPSTRINAGASSMPKASASLGNNAPERSFLDRVFERFGKSAGVKAGKIVVEERARDKNDMGLLDYVAASPSRIAEKVKMFRQFFVMGDRAMNVLTKNRSDFNRKLEQAFGLVKKKEDREDLFNLLLIGDAEGKEYTREQLLNEEGVEENVAEAYARIRRLMTKAYRMVNEARRRPQMHTRRMTQKQIDELRENRFVEIKSEGKEDEDGKRIVSYKEYANWEKTCTVDTETLARFESDDAMQVLEYEENEDGTFDVTIRESIPPVNKLTGYIPHFFHDYMIRVKDEEGNYVATIGSGRTQADAVKKAEEWRKRNDLPEGQRIFVSPKAFDFTSLGMDESQYAAVLGDKDFDRMMESIAEHNDLTLEEAKEMMKGSAKKKSRHRFLGNLMHRKGVAGYEQDLGWVLRHYFNSASRYAALETEFKPKAISLFERYFGDFNKDHTGLAQYTKDYINDINGNPTALEEAINKTLNKSSLWRRLVVSNFGERSALQLSNTVTNWTSMLCLGYLNASSAILNFTQAINAAGYLGSARAAAKIFQHGFRRKYGLKDMRVLIETNVMNDIGLDSGSGYDTNRGYAGKAMGTLGKISQKGMILFKTSEGAMRRGTVLAAYEKAVREGKSHAEAIRYAKEINRKSNFDYGVADAPNAFRRGSIFSQLALQFKKYAFKELEVMGDMLPMFGSSTSRKQKLLFWGMYFLACGLLQVPAVDWLDKLLGENLKDFAQKSIMEACGGSEIGKAIGRAAMYGLPSVGGIDISSRAGMADVVPSKASDLLGPAASRTASLLSDLAKGDGAAAIRDISPGLYNQYAAWIAEESTGTRGRVNSKYDDIFSKMLKSIGFRSTEERIASDIQRITYNEKDRLSKEKQAAVDAYLADETTENAKRLKELGIKPEIVKKERERKKMDRHERTRAGLSKDEQKRFQDMLRFAE